MATEKNINARVTLKHDKEENWLKATTFVPKAGELIIYDPDTTYNYTRIKIGDGSTKVNALPFSFDKGKLQDKLTAGSNITISGNTISSPSISITNGTATTPTGDTVAVISGETASGHTITNTKVNVATKDYVDRKSVAAVQYLGTVSNTNELAALNPNSVGDFCRVAAAFSSYHAGDLLLCKTLKTSSAAATWDVIHGEIDKDTWTANSKSAAGYVVAGGTNANKVWKTDASGNPAWRDDANTNTAHAHSVGSGLSIEGSGDISGTTKYSLKVASSSEIGGVKPGTTSGKTYGVTVASDGAMTVSVPWTDTNTDTKVTQTVTSSNAAYPLLLAPSGQTATTTTTSYFDSGVTLNPSTNTIAANISGNAATAAKLQTARTISLSGDASGSITFDGSADKTLTVTVVDDSHNHVISNVDGLQTALDGKAPTSHTHNYAGSSSAGGAALTALTVGQGNNPDTAFDANDIIVAGSKKTFYTTNSNKMSNRPSGTSWGYLNIGSYDNSGTYMYQTFIDGDNGDKYIRTKYNKTWRSWIKLLTDNNYTSYTVTKTGSGASGTWSINITGSSTSCTGNAATATKATQDGDGNVITSTYSVKSHTHSVTAKGTNASVELTPAGTVSQPTFTGTAASHNHTFTGTAAEHTHTFTGTEKTASVKYTPEGTVSSSFTGTAHNHTFSGTPATSGKPDTTNVTTIYSITGVGTLPSASLSSGTLPSCSYTAPSHTYTAPSLTGSVSNQCLTLSFSAGSHSFNAGSHSFNAGAFPTLTFSAGTLPTREAVSMPNTNHTHSVTATGTIGNATAGGSVSSTFAGTEATISHTFTPAGSISKTSLTPAGTISSKELTPAGTVSKPTFTGTAASHTHTFTGSAVNSATES